MLPNLGQEVAHIAMPKVGEFSEQSVVIAEGTSIAFVTRADRTSYDGPDGEMSLEVKLMHEKNLVDELQCAGPIFDSDHRGGCGGKTHDSRCDFVVPKGGVDSIRVRTKLPAGGSATFDGLEVVVYRK